MRAITVRPLRRILGMGFGLAPGVWVDGSKPPAPAGGSGRVTRRASMYEPSGTACLTARSFQCVGRCGFVGAVLVTFGAGAG
jgi:hypothetical protein